MTDSSTEIKSHPLLAVVLFFTVPLIIGAAIAPYVFNWLHGLETDAIPKLTGAKFERVANRCVMIVAALMLYPVIKMTGQLPHVKQGLRASASRFRELRSSVIVGCLSMVVLYGAGKILGAYEFGTKYHGAFPFLLTFISFLTGSVFIGIFEEIFFRGIIFGALRSQLGFIRALITSSVLFSAIHFMRPKYPVLIEHADWNTGFAILPYMFEKFAWPQDLLFAATLFVMGLALATFYEKRGSLYYIIGLHGGWVLAMQTGSYLFDRNRDVMVSLFGTSDLISKGWLALAVVTIFWIIALRSKKAAPHIA